MTEQNNPQVSAVPSVQSVAQSPAAATSNLMIPVSIVFSGALMSAALFFGLQGNVKPGTDFAPAPTVAPTAIPVDIAKVKIDGNPFIGKADAPVVVAVWSDYQCPFCKRFDQDSVKRLIAEYADTGKVKVVFKDFAFLGPDSDDASRIARAVWEVAPEKFAAWHTAMFAKQDAENGGWGSEADILALTKSLGIDSNKVAGLLAAKKDEYQKALDADKEEGGTFGINGTPGTIIGTDILSGALPYANVKALVEKALAAKK
jgi:protein-disulfide isomerase